MIAISSVFSAITHPGRRAAGLSVVFFFIFVLSGFAAGADRPPNVVFIYADDLGYADISYNKAVAKKGRRNPYLVHSPNIDKICKNGIFLTNYVTHHVCSPSRAGVLTGRHYTQVGSGVGVGGYLDDDVSTIGKDFQANGYVTGAFGKWHNGREPMPNSSKGAISGLSVNTYGFNEWAGFYAGGQDYHTRVGKNGEIDWWTNEKRHTKDVEGYSTYIIRDNVLDFIDNNADNPFFVYMSLSAVHTPYHILNTDLKEMCDLFDDKYPQFAWEKVSKVVSPAKNSKRTIGEALKMRCAGKEEFDRSKIEKKIKGFKKLVFYTMVYAVDRAVGEVLDKLSEKGLSDNTIVVFTSDNGATRSGDNGKFRGHKMTIWEGGIHVPAAVWWPGHLDSSVAPYSASDNTYDHMMQYIDWYPTLMGAAGKKVSPDAKLDGLNLYPNLSGRTTSRRDNENWYYGLHNNWAVLRNGRYKLHYNQLPGDDHVDELYDLQKAPGETNNLAGNVEYKELHEAMKKELNNWFAANGVTASYMPLFENYDRKATAKPEGDVLEVTAEQTGKQTKPEKEGIQLRFGKPQWGRDRDDCIHAGDILEYDLCVAEDSDQIQGVFVSPSYYVPAKSEGPLFNTKHGLGLDGKLMVDHEFTKGKWTRCAVGIGEAAPGRSLDMTIGLQSKKPGKYHFYLDNIVIRKSDGTIRVVVWENKSHSNRGSTWVHFMGRNFSSFDKLPPKNPNLRFKSASITTRSAQSAR